MGSRIYNLATVADLGLAAILKTMGVFNADVRQKWTVKILKLASPNVPCLSATWWLTEHISSY